MASQDEAQIDWLLGLYLFAESTPIEALQHLGQFHDRRTRIAILEMHRQSADSISTVLILPSSP